MATAVDRFRLRVPPGRIGIRNARSPGILQSSSPAGLWSPFRRPGSHLARTWHPRVNSSLWSIDTRNLFPRMSASQFGKIFPDMKIHILPVIEARPLHILVLKGKSERLHQMQEPSLSPDARRPAAPALCGISGSSRTMLNIFRKSRTDPPRLPRSPKIGIKVSTGRASGIRTHGLYTPSVARYQTAP